MHIMKSNIWRRLAKRKSRCSAHCHLNIHLSWFGAGALQLKGRIFCNVANITITSRFYLEITIFWPNDVCRFLPIFWWYLDFADFYWFFLDFPNFLVFRTLADFISMLMFATLIFWISWLYISKHLNLDFGIEAQRLKLWGMGIMDIKGKPLDVSIGALKLCMESKKSDWGLEWIWINLIGHFIFNESQWTRFHNLTFEIKDGNAGKIKPHPLISIHNKKLSESNN